MGIIAWIVFGLIAGFIASKIVNRTGEGPLLDIVLGQAPDEPLLVDLPIDPFSLTGQIESIYGGRIVRFSCATLKAKGPAASLDQSSGPLRGRTCRGSQNGAHRHRRDR